MYLEMACMVSSSTRSLPLMHALLGIHLKITEKFQEDVGVNN